MALCLAHATAGYLAYEALRPAGPHRPWLLAGAVVLANVPDLDFLPGLAVGDPDAYHRGVTHTLLAALVVAAGVGLVARWRRVPRAWWWAAFAAVAYGSHLLVDWMTVDVVPPHGIQLLWPFSDRWLHAPGSLLGEIVIDRSGRLAFVASLLTPAALLAWAREVAILIAAVALVHLARALVTLRGPVAEESLEP
jgi:inner membrane protein